LTAEKPAPAVVGEAATCTLGEATASKRCTDEMTESIGRYGYKCVAMDDKTRDETRTNDE
jgi:hypothetical protein